MDYVDNYCERIGPGLWEEPLNAITNVAFLIAASVLFWLFSKQRTTVPVSVWLFPVTTAVVGLCSFAFHIFATTFTRTLDSLSIAVFILITSVVAVHIVWGVRWRWAWLAAPAFFVVTYAITVVVGEIDASRTVLGGYLSALLALVGFGVAIRLKAPVEVRRHGTLLFWTAALFGVSLTLRTLDGPLCAELPIGLHFLWHCLNAVVMFLTSYTVFRCWRAVTAMNLVRRSADAKNSG